MKQPDNPFASEAISAAYNDEWQAKRRVAQALKQLIEVLVTSTPPIDELQGIAESLEQAATRFADCPRLYGRAAFMEGSSHGNFGQLAHELNPLSGLSNPLAPPVNMWIKDDRAYGTVTVGWAYEGPPGTLHGGYVAAIFDQFLGMAQMIGKQPGMTGILTTRYHQRTPLNTELRLEAWINKLQGRKTMVRGEMYAGDILTASCEGLFVQPRGGLQKIQPQHEAGDEPGT
jgi:hypothetical protein